MKKSEKRSGEGVDDDERNYQKWTEINVVRFTAAEKWKHDDAGEKVG